MTVLERPDDVVAPLEADRTRSGVPLSYDVDTTQQYLAKNPFGYRCHANTGVNFPDLG